MESYNEIWEKVMVLLRKKYAPAMMKLFFNETSLLFMSDKIALVQNMNDNLVGVLASQHRDELTDMLEEVTGKRVRMYFESAESKPVELAKYTTDPNGPIYSEGGKEDEPNFVEPGSDKYGNFFDPRYTFDNFIVGSSNTFAHAACIAVAREGAGAGYNPLFIYGDSGLGKTHLLYAIINETLKNRPATKIVYAKGDDFTNEIIHAIENSRREELREKYRKADMLLIDDVQFIAGKNSTQEEFFHTFNTLYEDNKQIVLTSDRPPRDIKALEDRIRNRFEWGLLADISAPDYELRIAIMQNKAKTYHVELPNDVFAFLAENLRTNIRQMEGAIKKIAAVARLSGRPVTTELAANCISDMVSGKEPDSVVAAKVIDAVSKKYGISESEIRGKKRTKDIVRARNIAIYIIRDITDMSLPKIGSEFGRNHTTIMSSLSVVEKDLSKSSYLEPEIKELIKEIKE